MMPPPSHLATFVHEVEDLLARIEEAILALETAPGDAELINQLFRAFHTLKGSAGVVGVKPIAAFTHHVETAMDLVRNGSVALTPALVSAVLAARDHVAALMAAVVAGAPCDTTMGDRLVATLERLTMAGGQAVTLATVPAPAQLTEYLVTFTPTAELEALDVDPEALLEELRALGPCTVLTAPTLIGSEPWKVMLTTSRGTDAIRDAFIFVAGAGELEIDEGLAGFDDEPVASAPVAPAPSTALAVAVSPLVARKAPESSVRVSSERLDQLVKLIGELVITQARLQQVHSLRPSPELAEPVDAFERLIGELLDGVLGLRMVRIGTLFTRFHRLIRDLSAELHKDVELVTTGDDTELDKTVIDQLGDALVHILRNSLDHGFETPAQRIAAGKPSRGTLRLAATHEGAQVVITISDDGRGVDAQAVRRKAEAQGLIAPGDVLSERDTLALIMRPGFSTATSVTELSGRGVGMDVVKKTLEGLRGTIAITSRAGAGTEIRLRLPLTLAIIDGLLVEIHGDRFIIPMAEVSENLELTDAERHANNGRNVVALRGEMVPYIRMRELFEHAETSAPLEKVVVVAVGGERVGLVVDRVVGNHQTVIQPLGRFYRGVSLFSGTTILGDGRVAMILDIPGLVRRASAPAGSPFTTQDLR